jgi:hypothetical protein
MLHALLTTLLFIAPAATQPATRPMAAEQAAEMLQNYYLDPQPEVLPDMMRGLADGGAMAPQQAGSSVVGFVAGASRADEGLIGVFAEVAADLPAVSAQPIVVGLQLADTEATRAALARLQADRPVPLADLAAAEFPNLPIDGPSTLDLWWGAFFATGDKTYPKLVADALNDLPEGDLEAAVAEAARAGDRDKALALATAGSAEWSLNALMRDHPRIADALHEKQRDPATPQAVRIRLFTMLLTHATRTNDADLARELQQSR